MKKILIAVDFSDVTGRVVNEGVDMAKAFGATVCLMHTEPPTDGYIYYDAGYPSMGTMGYMNEFDPDLEKSHQERIKNDEHSLKVLKSVVEKKGVKATTFLIEGDVSKALIQHVQDNDFDMIVIGNHRHGKLYKFIFDDVSTHLLNKTTCPVLIVPTKVN